MNLAKEISFLLFKHNCVILPGFGAFLLHDKPAERNQTANYALPKQRAVTFNKQIINNDGLVANYISTVYHCTYEQGIEKINIFVQSLWDVLQTKRNIEIAEIGTFYYTQENKLVFVPHLAVNFNTATYGLPKLRLKTLKPATQTTKILPTIDEKNTDDNPPHIEVRQVKKNTADREQHLSKDKAQKAVLDTSKTKKRNEKLLENKRANRTNKGHKKPMISVLSVVNTLGVCFLIGMVFSLFQFEKNQTNQNYADQEIASLLEAPAAAPDQKQAIEVRFGIFAETQNRNEALQLITKLRNKYENASIDAVSEKTCSVFVISFSNLDLAQEYKNLLQNIMDQKLVIRQK